MTNESTTRGTKSHRLLRLLLSCLVFVALVDPSDSLTHLKVPFFASVIAVWVYRYIGSRIGTIDAKPHATRLDLWVTVFVVSILVPSIATIVGILGSDVHSGNAPLSLVKSFLFFSIAAVLANEKCDLILIIIRLSFVVALITLAMVLVSLVWPMPFLLISDFLMSRQTAIITPDRDVTGVAAGEFYYATCPLLIFSFAYYFNRVLNCGEARKRDILLPILFGVSLLVSGARANLLAMLFVFTFLGLRRFLRNFGWAPTIILGTTLLLAATAVVIPKFADTAEGSNAVKLKHIHSYVEEFSARPAALLWGEGANSSFYSEGFQSWTTVTEITYFELVRVFGLPVTLLFIIWLAWIGYAIFRKGPMPIALAYCAYIAMAASNPLLINSTGFLVIASMYEQATKTLSPVLISSSRFKLWGRTSDKIRPLKC